MKTKIPILIVASLLIAFTTRAQYPDAYARNQVIVQGQIQVPGKVYIDYGYNSRTRYYDNGRDHRSVRSYYAEPYNNRPDWREIEYQRYCRERHDYRMSREAFYYNHCNYPSYPAPKRVVCR